MIVQLKKLAWEIILPTNIRRETFGPLVWHDRLTESLGGDPIVKAYEEENDQNDHVIWLEPKA